MFRGDEIPARKMAQSKEIKELFYKKIQEKVQREKDRIKGRVEEELPAWAAWVFNLWLVCITMFKPQKTITGARTES